ncbi:hypothetical protein QM012_004113 [Aureobasidium pullulans]|uniref:Uncharacterized protein n=1 Tax=Aureobasidium pullulans TaxID=5580 RepID=A0ABR0T807_AURPU
MSASNNTKSPSVQENFKTDTNHETYSRRPLRLDPDGVLNIGRDGVLRSLNAHHTVVLDVRRLSPKEIADVIAPADQATKDAMVGVDGRDVTDVTQLWTVPTVYPVADESNIREPAVISAGQSKSKTDTDNTTGRRPWRRDPNGVSHLGRDGVLRSLNADRTMVLDARRLTPEEIKNLAEPFDQASKDTLIGVDGRDVTDVAQLRAVPIVDSVADESRIHKPAVAADQKTVSGGSSAS